MKKNLTLLCATLTFVSSLVATDHEDDISNNSNPFGAFHVSSSSINTVRQSIAPVPTTWSDLENYLITNFPNHCGNNYTVSLFVIALHSIEQKHLAKSTSTATRMKILNEQMMFIVSTWCGSSSVANINEVWYLQNVGWSPTRFTPIYQFIYNRAFPPTQTVVDEDKGCCSSFLRWFK